MPAAANVSLADWLGSPGPDVMVRDIHLDSRKVGAGDAFIALRGEQSDGRDFISDAVSQGAVAILVDAAEGDYSAGNDSNVPLLAVPGLSERLGELSAKFYGPRYRGVQLFGVTGTNGKTTVVQLLTQLLDSMGEKAASIGTLGWGFGEDLREPGLTTPDVISVHRTVARIADEGGRYIAMEVSSHGLAQQRTQGLQFSAAMFTNLSRDHLDYHGDMASYAAEKRKLFLGDISYALLNVDDACGRDLYMDSEISCQRVAYALADKSADIYCSSLSFSKDGCEAHVITPWGEADLSSPLLGEFNLSNLLGAIGMLAAAGFSLPALCEGSAKLKGAAGRMQPVHQDDITVLVDYAHTPDALEKVLTAVRPHVEGKLWLVVGCGGDRDKGKRPEMACVAESLADELVFTSDNPRGENPEDIIQDMLSGVGKPEELTCKLDRQAAIEFALAGASTGDLVLIAGKGHEDYQEIKGQRIPFSDQLCVERYYGELH